MLDIKHYVRPGSLAQAYELCQKRSNVVVGGMLWLKMQNKRIDTAIDLCDLGLDFIKNQEDEIQIGAMTTLRQLELSPLLDQYTRGAVRESVRHIVGVQFRNMATVGGSLFGRYGFSDVLTVFMAMDAYVELYHGGIIPIRQFAAMRRTPDILVKVILEKTPLRIAYLSQRNTRTDFPVLTCAVSQIGDTYSCVIGARPLMAAAFEDTGCLLDTALTDESIRAFAGDVKDRVVVGSNLRGSADYRRHIAGVLVKRGLIALREGDHDDR